MRRNLENIEIVEPPIEELTKKRSWKGTCLSSCILLIILIIVAIIGIRLYVGPGPQVIKTIPADFPTDIPIYDPDAIEDITFITARYKERGLGIATVIPKIILSPVFYNRNTDANGQQTLKNIWNAMIVPDEDYRDSIQIEWRMMDADPGFVISYYKKELMKKNYKIDVESEGKNIKQFSFSRTDGLDGSIYAQVAEGKKTGTDYMILTINFPKK